MKWINKLSDKDFHNLTRNGDGDIVDLYNIHHLLTDDQLERLSDDDWSRVSEYCDELEYLRHQAQEEFST